MPRSPLTLAALASAAIAGLDVRSTRGVASTGGFDIAVVTDAAGRAWTVRAPRTPAAGAALEAEADLLEQLRMRRDSGALSFMVPQIRASVALPEGGRAVVHQLMGGKPVDIQGLRGGPGLAADLGRVLASVHELPRSVVEDCGLPSYTADEYRQRRLAEIDEAARTARVPTELLRRWEQSLENVAMWRFAPVVVHGDLGPEQVLVKRSRVVGITDWAEARVADPADDLAWLVVAAPPPAVEAIIEAYQLGRTELRDPCLTERAYLVGELALARWLLYGVRNNLPEVIADAEGMLADLARSTTPDEPQ